MSPIALIFLSTLAAQTEAPPKPAVNPPTAAGAPHTCAGYYPIPALQTKAQGTTLVGFDVTATGSVANVAVKTSSGNADLDKASVACTKTWQYHPATLKADGTPVAVPWQVAVKWEDRLLPPFDAISDTAYRCVLSTDAGRDEMSKAKLRTVVRVHFAKGNVESVEVVGSSGDSGLDRHVADCYGRVAPALTASLQDDVYQLLTPMPAAVQ